MSLIATQSLTDRISLTLDGLYRAVAARIAGGAMLAAMIVMVCGRVRRVELHILRLLARFRAGRLLVRVSQPGGARAGVRGAATARWPRGFGWLIPMVPQHAAGYASQLRFTLADPEMVALLAACPQARRVLAPLCRMLGIEPELLGPVPEGRAAKRAEIAVPKEVRTRVRRSLKQSDLWRIPLPRGVQSAARRQGFWKLPRD